MKTSENGLKLIESSEALRLAAYQDDVGIWTIGYGHTGPEVVTGLEWTEDEADQQLSVDVRKVESALNGYFTIHAQLKPTQNQFDALVDFGFNLGTGALKTMLDHGWDQVPQQIPRWNKGKVKGETVALAGLTKRRAAEVALWNEVNDAN